MDNLLGKAQKILEKINLSSKQIEAREIEEKMRFPDFWQNRELAAQNAKKLASLQTLITKLDRIQELVVKVENNQLTPEEEADFVKLVTELETRVYLSGKYDSLDALVAIHSGQGGVEAMDWAQMLYRMYSQFVKSKNWELEELDYDPGTEAGIKSVTFEVRGENAYGLLKHEAGVHRLVRQSPFNADHLRQTSFALVEIMPVLSESKNEDLLIREEDLIWEFYRSGGHGGQNVNKVSSAVRLIHKPTKITVSSQRERDQSRNRAIALKLLKAKLLALEEERVKEEKARLKGQHLTPGWGNQIRSYVLHPYHLVKDLRTGWEETDSEAVLNGKLDNFIASELHYFA